MIFRCFDYRRIKKLVNWPLVFSSKIYYLIENDGKKDNGLWTFEEHGEGVKGHADMGKHHRGNKAVASAKAAIEWIFANTGAAYVCASIPAENKKACRLAHSCGMASHDSNDTSRFFKIKR